MEPMSAIIICIICIICIIMNMLDMPPIMFIGPIADIIMGLIIVFFPPNR